MNHQMQLAQISYKTENGQPAPTSSFSSPSFHTDLNFYLGAALSLAVAACKPLWTYFTATSKVEDDRVNMLIQNLIEHNKQLEVAVTNLSVEIRELRQQLTH